MYFVWIKGQKENSCEIWPENLTTGTNKFQHGSVKNINEAKPGDLIAFNKITLEELKLFYPCPK